MQRTLTGTFTIPSSIAAERYSVLDPDDAWFDAAGGKLEVTPYLGMFDHVAVMRRDRGMFVQLHPSGTSSMASEIAFATRDRGDTTADGRLRLGASDMATTMRAHGQTQRTGDIAFPYAFPSAGAYRVWGQLRADGKVRTAAFDVNVGAAPTGPIRAG